MDKLTFEELSWLIENDNENKKEHYEMMEMVFAFGYASAKKGKIIPMFKKERNHKVKKIEKEEKEKQLQYLNSLF